VAIRRFISNSFANGSLTRSKFANNVFDILGIANVRVANDSFGVLEGVNTFFCDTGGSKVVIDGQGFDSTVSVLVDDSLASVVSRVSSNTLHVTLPAKTSGTYSLYVVNSDGQAVVRPDLTYINYPDWVTDYILTPAVPGTPYSNQLEATGAITYELSNTSTLPSWLTLSANGLLSSSNVDYTELDPIQYSFTIIAKNSSNTAIPRTFLLNLFIGDFAISPAVNGRNAWSFLADGNLIITTPGEYTITPSSSNTFFVKMWGAGGGPASLGNAGWGAGLSGGAATGLVSFVENVSYKIRVPIFGHHSTTNTSLTQYRWGGGNGGTQFGGSGQGLAGSGGGYAGLFRGGVSQANAILIAGGGGGGGGSRSDALGGRPGGVGGGTTGGNSNQGPSNEAGPSGGTQSAGGTAVGGQSSTAGSALQGGTGGGGGAGGGGGWYGGGGGGQHIDGGYGGGGGSGFVNTSVVSFSTLYSGTGIYLPGNSTDADRPANTGFGNYPNTVTSSTSGAGNGAVILVSNAFYPASNSYTKMGTNVPVNTGSYLDVGYSEGVLYVVRADWGGAHTFCYVYRSFDYGASWSLVSTLSGSGTSIYNGDILVLNKSTLIVLHRGVFFRSTNYGASFSTILSTTGGQNNFGKLTTDGTYGACLGYSRNVYTDNNWTTAAETGTALGISYGGGPLTQGNNVFLHSGFGSSGSPTNYYFADNRAANTSATVSTGVNQNWASTNPNTGLFVIRSNQEGQSTYTIRVGTYPSSTATVANSTGVSGALTTYPVINKQNKVVFSSAGGITVLNPTTNSTYNASAMTSVTNMCRGEGNTIFLVNSSGEVYSLVP
jgi:hypothetical protein